MDMSKKKGENERFVELIKLNKQKGVSYTATANRAGFKPEFIRSVMHGRSTAYEIHVLQLLESFPDLDPDFKEENIVEAIKRIEQEKETIKAEIKELQAAVFKMQAKCK
jgi:hypothetical protein